MNRVDEIAFYDLHPPAVDFYDEVITGLSKTQKTISPKFFYDEIGSRLFSEICEQHEYYVTRTETQLLKTHTKEIASLMGKRRLLVEPGSGDSNKVRLLLSALQPEAYLPMDISKDFLIESAESLSEDYPWLEVHAVCADFTAPLALPFTPAGVSRAAFFPGSSIGNFEPQEAVAFLSNIGQMIDVGGLLLIGVDLQKEHKLLRAAYNDRQGITAEFNLNLLRRINREIGANFDINQFSHLSFYNAEKNRIEMHLVSKNDQTVSIKQNPIHFHEGETIHTENSYKYSVESFTSLAKQAGYTSTRVWQDNDNLFSIHLLMFTGKRLTQDKP